MVVFADMYCLMYFKNVSIFVIVAADIAGMCREIFESSLVQIQNPSLSAGTENVFWFIGECFVVRPDNSEDHRRIGSRGSLCLLHVSPWGLTLALQVGG